MTNEEFIELEYKFIEELKASRTYKWAKRLSEGISKDRLLQMYNEHKSALIEMLNVIEEEDARREILIQIKNVDDRIQENPLVVEYNKTYDKIKKCIRYIEEELRKIIL